MKLKDLPLTAAFLTKRGISQFAASRPKLAGKQALRVPLNETKPLTLGMESHGTAAPFSRAKPSTFQPSAPPIIFFTFRPRRARRAAARSAPLQCGPLQ